MVFINQVIIHMGEKIYTNGYYNTNNIIIGHKLQYIFDNQCVATLSDI